MRNGLLLRSSRSRLTGIASPTLHPILSPRAVPPYSRASSAAVGYARTAAAPLRPSVTSQPPRRNADPTFHSVESLLADKWVRPLSVLLSAIPDHAFTDTSTKWTKDLLLGLLAAPADEVSLIRLLPIIKRVIDGEQVRELRDISRPVMKRLRMGRMLVELPVFIDMALGRMEAAAESGEAKPEALMRIIASLLGGLRRFRHFSTLNDRDAYANSLPPMVNAQAVRLTAFAIQLAETQPSSSLAPSVISDLIRERLFDRVLLTPEIRRMLLAHLPRKLTTAGEFRACAMSMIREGKADTVKRAEGLIVRAQKADRRLALPPRVYPFAEEAEDEDPQLELVHAEAEGASGQTGTRSPNLVLDAVEAIALARCGSTARAVLGALEPYLNSPEPADAGGPVSAEASARQPYAWSILMHRLSGSSHTTADDLLGLTSELSEELMIPQIMSPLIAGLISRRDLTPAWDIFVDLCEKQRAENVPGRYVDRQLLAAATPLCAQLFGLDAAVQLVDEWARRTTGPSPTDWRHSITIDSVNLNTLLTQCAQFSRPGIALRLFAAAQRRWGLWPDHISLNILVDCCRFSQTTDADEPDSIRSRLRDLVGEMRLFGSKELDNPGDTDMVHDIPELADGDVGILLDREGMSWRETMGDMRPWQFGRRIVRDVILGNWPYLVDVPSPLDFGPFAKLDDILRPYPSAHPDELRLPLLTARYTHIIPSAGTFQSYITLLGFYGRIEEIPVVLAWARELGVQLNTKSMCSALAYIGEVEGPRRRVRGWKPEGGSAFVRDEEIMRRWLQEWIRGEVPSEGDVAAFVREVKVKGAALSAPR